MGISAVTDFGDTSSLTEDLSPPLNPSWKRVSEWILAGSFLSGAACLSTLIRKRRVYTQIAPAAPLIELGGPEPEEEVKLPSPEEKAIAQWIFTTIAANATWKKSFTLASHTSQLESEGDKIKGLHPFSLFLSLPKESIQTIFHTGTFFVQQNVRTNFFSALQSRSGTLKRQASSLARAMGKEPETVKRLVQALNWRELVRYLFDLRSNALHEE